MLWGAFNNATQGMMATSWDMGSISQNISNVNTIGYKRKETMFKTLLSGTHAAPAGSSGGLDIFSVKAVDRFHIQEQGVLTPTYQWSDLGISGRGFFMVAPPTAPGVPPTTGNVANPNAVMYTRAGTFNQIAAADGNNYFVSGSGHHLLGWMADQTGALNTNTLQPLFTQPTTVMDGRPTGLATVIANLPASAPMTQNARTSSITMLPGDTGLPENEQVTLNWTRTGPTDWSVDIVPPAGATVTTGSPFTVSVDGYGNVLTDPSTFDVEIDWSGMGGNPAVTHSLTSQAIDPPAARLQKISMNVYDDASNAQALTLGFERVGTNEWYLHLPGNPTPLSVTFDSNGRIASGSPAAVTVDFNNAGPPPTVSNASFSLDLDKMSQFSGELYIGTISQDGFSEGVLRDARFNEYGDLIGSFSNGRSQRLARVPLATFISEDQLMPVAGTLFMRTLGAGDISVNAVEDVAGGSSRLSSSSVENSTVDIGDEFTRMIMTQKAYTSNATVFKTADEMITEARDLKS